MPQSLFRLLVVAFLCVSGVAHAGDDAATRSSKKHYERGEKLFALGKFDDALAEYQQAFDAKPLPDFLYNIGQCYRNLDDLDQAIFSFKKYLKLAPDAPDRDKVEKLIADLEDKKARGEGKKLIQPPPPPPPLPPPTAHTPIYKTWWFWTGVVAAGAATSFGIYEATKSSPPGTDLGNINFGR
jgi:tetratricopeptide (TPR) repeat protein